MKSFIFTLSLGMVRTRVTHRHSQSNQPCRQRCITRAIIASPRRTVIHGHAFGQSVAPKRLGQFQLYGLTLLVAAVFPTDHIALPTRHMMTVRTVIGSKPTFEIHLPELIGGFMFETVPRLMLQAFSPIDGSIPLQHSMNRTGDRHIPIAQHFKTSLDLACPPTSVLLAH